MDRLPPDVLALICSGLTGFDVFQLSHTSSWLLRSTTTDRIWRRLFRPSEQEAPSMTDTAVECKRMYIAARSLRFKGYPKLERGQYDRDLGDFVPVRQVPRAERLWSPTNALNHHFGPDRVCASVTIDTWFALLPETDRAHVGGILFGLQRLSIVSNMYAHPQHQPMLIDSNRRLFCSLVVGPAVRDEELVVSDPDDEIATLDVNRWYHLALTYAGPERTEKVFLDGELMTTRTGDWHLDWPLLGYGQVGVGWVVAGERSFPRQGSDFLYRFHGVVDEFRVREGVLTDGGVATLARGCIVGDENQLWYSIKQADAVEADAEERSPFEAELPIVERVRCSRPLERVLELS